MTTPSRFIARPAGHGPAAMFKDRFDAAAALADALWEYRHGTPVVLGIPRGGIVIASIVARRLGVALDAVFVRKLTAPGAHETAVGAIAESGWTYIAPHAAAMGAGETYLNGEACRQALEIERRRQLYMPSRPAVPLAGRTVIVVDDGMATGSTMMAALHAARNDSPRRLVCAVPVASWDSLECVRPVADETICLLVPPRFEAVAKYYGNFPQVGDADVITLLLEKPGPPP